MKTKFIISVMALLFNVSASLMASDPSPFFEIVNQKGSTIYKLVYKSPGEEKVYLKILDNSGSLVYAQFVNFTNGFTYPLDFKGMKEGEYAIEISNKDARLKKSLTYKMANPLAYVHIAKRPEEKYMLTITSKVAADFTVRIYDRWSREVFQKKEKVSKDFGLVYNLAKVEGPVTFRVTEEAGTVEVVQR
jgi:hypothetical protein